MRTHPPWTEMITECITTTLDGTRDGVSRPAIKKFVDSKYHLPMNAATTSQLNRAIAHGTQRGDFTLPKGPSGKVKLAPERGGPATSGLLSKPPAKTAPKPPVSTTTGPFVEEEQHPGATRLRKYTSKAKRARMPGGQTRSATKRSTKSARINDGLDPYGGI